MEGEAEEAAAKIKEKSVSPADIFEELACGAESFCQSSFVAKLPKTEGEKEDEEFSEEDIGLLDEEKAGAVGSETFRASRS